MQVQIHNYLPLTEKYKIPLFIHGIGSSVKKVLNEIRKNMNGNFLSFLKSFDISSRMFYYYEAGRKGIPTTVLIKLLKEYEKITNENIDKLLDELFISFTGISSRGSSPIFLPKIYSSDLAYLTGFVIGDGHVSKRFEITIWEETKIHTNYIRKLINSIFKYEPTLIPEGNYYKIIITSAPIHFFFTKVVGLPEGKKKYKEKVPQFVLLNPQFIPYFLRGLFDSDGRVTISKYNKKSILLSSVNKKFLLEVKLLLRRFEIDFPGPYSSGNRRGFELRSFNKKDIKKFNEKIGFLHPIKHKRFNALIA